MVIPFSARILPVLASGWLLVAKGLGDYCPHASASLLAAQLLGERSLVSPRPRLPQDLYLTEASA